MRAKEPLTLKRLVRWQKERQPRGIVFLLGAGASADAGVPTSVEMLDRLRSPKCPEQALLSKLEAARQFSNVEDLLLTLQVLAEPEASELFPLAASWRVPLGDGAFRSSVLRLRDFVQRRLHKWLRPVKDYSYLARIYNFASSGKPSKRKRHSIYTFTLNYDLAVEMACNLRGIPCWTGYEEEHWEPSPVLLFDPRLFTNPGVHLYKLHGSLNWGVIKRRKSEAPEFTTVVGVERKIFLMHRGPFSWAREQWLPRDVRERGFYLDSFGGPMKGMIFGVKDKTAAYPPFINLQLAFNEAVGRAKALIVLGYSWSDPHINFRIQREWRATYHDLFVVDVVQDAMKACTDPRRFADVFVGGGVKAALDGEEVQLVVKSMSGPVEMSVKDGLAGALRSLPKLYTQKRQCFSRAEWDDYFDLGVEQVQKFHESLLRESYTKSVVP